MTQPTDPTKVRNQPALNTGSGLAWLVVGGIITATAGAFFAFAVAAELQPPGLALAGLLVTLLLYAGMVTVHLLHVANPQRLRAQAMLLISLSVMSLMCLGIIAWAEWTG
ncbi:MAG TPA: hypothetical protein VLO00_10040 [Cryobacterium sp.]|nr:hypothetical protein [Cryobacterium sp.]